MSPDAVSALNNISVALWVIAIMVILGTLALVITLYYIFRLLGNIMLLINELKAQTKLLSNKLDPLVNSAVDALKDFKEVTNKINIVASNLSEIGSSIAGIISFLNIFNMFKIGKGGFFSGIKTGMNVVKKIKNSKGVKK